MATRTLTIPDAADTLLIKIAAVYGVSVEALLMGWCRERWLEEAARRKTTVARALVEKWDTLSESRKTAIETAVG